MRYLLDELQVHENDHSDALAPSSQEAGQLPAGEAAFARPVATEALQTAHHMALMADVRVLQATVDKINASQTVMLDDIRGLREQFSNTVNHLPSYLVCPGTQCLSNPSPPSVQSGNGTYFQRSLYSTSSLTDLSHYSAPAVLIRTPAFCRRGQLCPANASSVSPAIISPQPGAK